MPSWKNPNLRVLIIDGYTDEPAGLGVPPYIDVYPRYIAGAVWDHDHGAEVIYRTIDQARAEPEAIQRISQTCDLSVLIAGVTVPGKYLGGAPATVKDALTLPRLLQGHTAICGPSARFGFGKGGGSICKVPAELPSLYEFIISGDPEIVISELLVSGLSNADLSLEREGWEELDRFAARGAKIIEQHPSYPAGLICEIETYRGCPRALSGGCSFCTEPLHGAPSFRSVQGIAEEMAYLSSSGAVNFRLGRQPDLLIYGSKDGNGFPSPDPAKLKLLLSAVRRSAPSLRVLHIDNINPATVSNYPEASEAALREILNYHTPGDVAALGIESADEEVIRRNNLKVHPEEAFLAISIINRVGSGRGENGMPQLLPGVNFVYGLPGETSHTFEANFEFMKRVLDSGLLIRRMNLRQVMVMPNTRLVSSGDHLARKHRSLFIRHKETMRSEIDEPMLRRVAPQWTVLRDVRTELVEGKMTWSRQIGSYPVLVGVPKVLTVGQFLDIVVLSHGPRSLSGLPVPLKINQAGLRELESIPGIGARRAALLIRSRPFRSAEELLSKTKIERPVIEPLMRLMDFAS